MSHAIVFGSNPPTRLLESTRSRLEPCHLALDSCASILASFRAVASTIPKRCQFKHCKEIVKEWASNRNKSSSVMLTYSQCKQCYQEKIPARPGHDAVDAWRLPAPADRR